MIKGTTASAREKEKIVFFGKSVRQPFFSWKILSRLRIFSASRWFLQKIMFNRAKRGEMRHPLVQSDTVKTLVEYYGIQFRRQIEWNLGEIALLSTARALEKRRFTKKKMRTRTRTKVFFRRRLAPTLFSRKQRRGRSSWRRLWCQQRRKLRKTFLLSVLRVRVWGFLASGVNFKARFPKKIKNSLSLLRDDEKVGCCSWFLLSACFWMEEVS